MEPGEDDDQRHVEGLRRRDPAVYEIVFKKYYSPLVVFASRQVGDGEVARDLVQDVFLKLFEESQVLPKNVCLKSWLYTSVRNAAIDYLRHMQVTDKHKFLVAEAMLASGEVDEKVDEEVCERVNRAVASLPEQCRLIIQKSVFEGKKYAEIAEEMGISINTIRTQVLRGYKKLREMLSDEGEVPILLILLRKSLMEEGCPLTED